MPPANKSCLMEKIYLASKSKARKKLLEKFGLKFKVLPATVKEKSRRGNLSYSQLVQNNARQKAEAAAARVAGGIIIAADTICVQDGKIFGKPKDLPGARRMLKKLSSKPQWLYTGLAVIHKTPGKQRRILGCEKTKVYMDKLSGKQIDRYFKQVSPLDKAGSFDIQGQGAFFIKRIEGCFYNVVGLPLRKLYLMLEKLDLKLFSLFLTSACLLSTVILSGCSTEYNLVTKQEEKYYYSTDKEVQMGQSINRRVEKELVFSGDPLQQKRVEEVGKKIAAVSDRKEIDYYFRVLDDEQINAVSLPGGYVYVNSGLLDKVDNDNELACILAHEVGHIVARHSIKKLQAMQSYSILRVLVAVAPAGSAEVGSAADAAFTQFLLGYSREDELLADQLGARYAKLAGYDPHGMIVFLTKLQDINRRMPVREQSYYKTHPYVPDRIRVVKQELGEQIDFGDYINIEQETHQ